MALINCPECSHSVSDKAFTCPCCGYPIQSMNKPQRQPYTRKPRHMKLPNKFGSIKKLSGNRRKPYAAFPPCIGFSETGSPIHPKAVGYFATYDEAYQALSEYHKNPFDTDNVRITFKELYKNYQNSKEYKALKERSLAAKVAAYKHCAPLYDIEVRKLNKAICEEVLDNVDTGSGTKRNVLSVMRTVVRYAMDMNLLTKDCTENITIEESDPVIDRIPFSKQEVATLWMNSDKWEYKIILILLYSGMRIGELLKNTVDNVNLEEKYIYIPKELAKNKTSERKIPIHDLILPLVKYFVDNPNRGNKNSFILNDSGNVVTYANFSTREMKKINKAMEHPHKFHDARHTFASMGTVSGIPELYMQKLLGHKPQSVLYNTYTHIEVEELRQYINMICY